jgi:hypothetical protein
METIIRNAAIWSLGACCLMVVLCGPLSGAEPPDFNRPDFNRDVRPILSAHCFKCHGPDDKTREAGLRLDVRDAATRELESGATAIVPGKTAASELVSRILATDESLVMPPPAANKPLSAAQKKRCKSGSPREPSTRRTGHFCGPNRASFRP